MFRACIAVVDASRARLFTLERTNEVEGLKEQISEARDLVNPARRLRPGDLFSDSQPAGGRTGPITYGVDDHREAHIGEIDAEFARAITAEVARLLSSTGAQRLILCASPKMLGALRAAGRLTQEGLRIDEVSRDLVKLTAAQLREQLASYGLLPPAVHRGPEA